MNAAVPCLEHLGPRARRDEFLALRHSRELQLSESRWDPYHQILASLKNLKAEHCLIDQPCVSFGKADELNKAETAVLRSALEALKPWKKGPFSLFGTYIDAEWRSDLKWQRLAAAVDSLEGQVVADIGCHNGYFMYRMLAHGARAVIGLEPYVRLRFIFEMLQGFHYFPQLHFELLGVEHSELFQESFDTIFCLGILYHHTDPVGLLRKVRSALSRRGRLFIDCQGIPGPEPLSLTPHGRYAGASGIWFLPTLSALQNWALRAGFSRIDTLYSEALSLDEQRTTVWAPVKSLRDFIDPLDPTRTLEGYPAPWRHYLLLRP